jgi:hypothetical protein
MNLKIAKIPTIELGCQCPKKADIKLLGISDLSKVNDSFRLALECKSITIDNLLSSVYDFDTKFFYVIEKVKDNVQSIRERGIGYLYKQDEDIYLKREQPICFNLNNDNNNYPCVNGPTDFIKDDEDTFILISSTVPPTYIENLYTSNCLITSSSPFYPQPIEIQPNSLVGRLQGDLQSLSLDDEDFVDSLIDCLSSFTKQLKLKTSKLDVKRLGTPLLQFTPTKNPQAKKGCLYYDEDTDLLKYFDGSRWRELTWKEGNGE